MQQIEVGMQKFDEELPFSLLFLSMKHFVSSALAMDSSRFYISTMKANVTLKNPSAGHCSVLMKELVRRTKINQAYSLRRFAQHLGMSPATLSGLLKGKRRISLEMAERVAERLALRPSQRDDFIRSVASSYLNGGEAESLSTAHFASLSEAEFQVISEWYHYAILELTYIPKQKNDPRWFAAKLGISVSETKDAIEKLKLLGLLKENARGVLFKTKKYIASSSGVASSAIKKRHEQVLAKARESLFNDALDERDITSITLAIDPELLPEAKKRIAKFRRELCEFLESKAPERVYEMSFQLFPLSKK